MTTYSTGCVMKKNTVFYFVTIVIGVALIYYLMTFQGISSFHLEGDSNQIVFFGFHDKEKVASLKTNYNRIPYALSKNIDLTQFGYYYSDEYEDFNDNAFFTAGESISKENFEGYLFSDLIEIHHLKYGGTISITYRLEYDEYGGEYAFLDYYFNGMPRFKGNIKGNNYQAYEDRVQFLVNLFDNNYLSIIVEYEQIDSISQNLVEDLLLEIYDNIDFSGKDIQKEPAQEQPKVNEEIVLEEPEHEDQVVSGPSVRKMECIDNSGNTMYVIFENNVCISWNMKMIQSYQDRGKYEADKKYLHSFDSYDDGDMVITRWIGTDYGLLNGTDELFMKKTYEEAMENVNKYGIECREQ